MRNLNLAVVEGNLTKDPVIRKTASGRSICSFYIGVNRDYKDKSGHFVPQASFIQITTWAKLADICSTYLKKGNKVLVNGVLRQTRWEDAKGNLRNSLQVIGREVFFLNTKGKSIKADDLQEAV